MSHEISVLESGLVEACYANKPAWHSLGTIFDLGGTQGMTSAVAARMSNLDAWTVSKEPLFWRDVSGNYKPVAELYGMVRSDIQQAFPGVGVGETYTPFQNYEAFGFLDSLVMDGILRYESAMALQGGKKIVLLARMPSVDTFAEGDYGLRYIMLSAGHDGNTPIDLLPTSIRVVCANTRRMALQQGHKVTFSIKHTGKTGEQLNKAKAFISQFDKGFTLYREQAALLATRQVSPSQVVEYLENLDKTLSSKTPDGKDKSGRGLTMRDNKIAEIRQFRLNPANVIPSIEGSWWGLVNAVTMAIDHGEKFTSRGSADDDGRAFQENKFLSLMSGGLSDLKDRAFTLACDMAGVA